METPVEGPFRAFTPDGRIMVEVSQRGTWFHCKTVLDGRHELSAMSTENADRVISWMQKEMAEAMRRSKKNPEA
jgi:hypothetical protein